MIIFKVSYDTGGGKKSLGARLGPQAIECAFRRYPWQGAEDGTPHPEIQWINCTLLLDRYQKKAASLFANMLVPFISLSGDNSCSFETVRVVAQHGKQIALAVLDAHPDTCDVSHDPHAHWVRRLWQEGIVAPEKTIFLGIRDPEAAEARFLKEKKTTVITADDIYFSPLTYLDSHAIARYANRCRPLVEHVLVIVVDIDVLDPTYAPGTGILRAGGLHVRHVLNIIRRLCALPFAMKIGEICEVIPKEGNALRPKSDKRPDPCGLTVLAAEAILREMIRRMQPQP